MVGVVARCLLLCVIVVVRSCSPFVVRVCFLLFGVEGCLLFVVVVVSGCVSLLGCGVFVMV